MREPIIDSEDVELEYNPYDVCCLRYKGELFTGTLIYNDTLPISFTEYKDGEFDGRDVTYHKNGNIQEDCVYENGKYISGKEWYDNGQLRYDSSKGHVFWDKDGLLMKKDGVYFYKNGIPRIKKDELGYYTLSPNGDVAIFNSTYSENNLPCKMTTTFFEKVVNRSLTEFFNNIYAYSDDNRDSRSGVDHQVSHYVICLYLMGYKSRAIAVTEQIIKDSVKRENDFCPIKHNYSSLKQHLEEDRIRDIYTHRTAECVNIIFD